MAKRTHVMVVALAGVLAGALVSTGVAELAQVIAYSGVNPEAAQEIRNDRQVDYYRNVRSILRSLQEGTSAEITGTK
ncbi:MAG: hypothetical protein PHS73_01180 [Candidatus Peribacteraceae bacterium]|nr:hypothetical protein [Candidatus Peribacteraceae bacterium]